MTEEQAADAAGVLGDRILDVAADLVGNAPVGQVAAVVLGAGLSAFVSLVAVSGGTRGGAQSLVDLMLPSILDDAFAGKG